jgi:hypothetical protein
MGNRDEFVSCQINKKLDGQLNTAQLALPEKPQEIAHQQDQQHRAKSYACATTRRRRVPEQ